MMEVPPLDGGLHLIDWLKPGVAQHRVLGAAESATVEVMAVSRFATKPITKRGIILGYAPYNKEQIDYSARVWRCTYAKAK